MPLIFRETLDTYDLSLRHRCPSGKRHDVVWGLAPPDPDVVGNTPGFAFLPSHRREISTASFVQDEIELLERPPLDPGSKV